MSNTEFADELARELARELEALCLPDGKALDIDSIPDDVFFEVLLRLPFVSLLRFRCVCQYCESMIADPLFIKNYSKRSVESLSFQRVIFTERYDSPPPPAYDCIEVSSSHALETSVQFPGNMDLKSKSVVQALCSCQGIILISVHSSKDYPFHVDSFTLWNPSMRTCSKTITFPYKKQNMVNAVYGLYYDEIIQDYRIFALANEVRVGYGGSQTVIMISDPTNSSWVRIIEPTYVVATSANGVFVNGALHWLISTDLIHNYIGYFDLAESKFKEVPLPSFWPRNSHELAELKGYLCMYAHNSHGGTEIWAMKEYGKKESWARLIVIPDEIGPRFSQLPQPLCLLSNGQILIRIEKEIGIYDAKDNAFHLVSRRDSWNYWSRAIPHVESLDSLSDVGEIQKHCQAKNNPSAPHVPQHNTACPTIFVTNLGPTCTEEELIEVFSSYRGFVELKMQSIDGAPVAFVEFMDAACSKTALTLLQGYILESSPPGGEGMRLEYGNQHSKKSR